MARKQLEIPGTEPKRIDEIDAAAESYVKARDTRMRKTVLEKDAKNALIAAMEKHKLLTYADRSTNPPLVVTVSSGKVDVKVAIAEKELEHQDEDETDDAA